MKLVIGGYAQGKLEYVIGKIKTDYRIIDETAFSNGKEGNTIASEADLISAPSGDVFPTVIVNHLHLIIRMLEDRKTIQSWICSLIKECAEREQELIFISDEVGNGVIPLDAGERQFRENTGRILCDLAGEADHVERVICGIPQTLK